MKEMIIESLELKNYRNYKELKLPFHPGSNLLYGDNAQGKTNILEALYLCAATKSHRGSKDRELIRFGEEEAHIRLNLTKNGVPYRIDMHLKKERAKGITVLLGAQLHPLPPALILGEHPCAVGGFIRRIVLP